MATTTLSNCLWQKIDSTAIAIPREPTPIVLSHRELRRHVLNFQRKLAGLGISHKDAVAIALPNSLEFVVAFLAISLQRAICAPLNPAYKQEEYEFYLNDLNAAVVLVPKGAIAENGEAIKAARACNTAVAEVSWDWCEVTIPDFELRGRLGRTKSSINTPEPQDVALILHTSGTTGRPKAVCLPKKSLLHSPIS
jgi:acyl-CoA synthetase (AMP-forming)/AMP-acid ligase II